jgi:hypothetical protein
MGERGREGGGAHVREGGRMRECVLARADIGVRPARDSRIPTLASRAFARISQSTNNLRPEGAMHLTGALEKMTGIQTLDLVSHVRLLVRARSGRLQDTGYGHYLGWLEAGHRKARCA